MLIALKWSALSRSLSASVCVAAMMICLYGQTKPSSRDAQSVSLRRFMDGYFTAHKVPKGKSTEYLFSFFDLNEDGTREALVYLNGERWCGSGGCTTLVLATQPFYRIVTKITVTRLPISVLPAKSFGWHDLAVWVGGGGIGSPYKSRLCFDGRTYPGNPTVYPARRLKRRAPGEIVLISTTLESAETVESSRR